VQTSVKANVGYVKDSRCRPVQPREYPKYESDVAFKYTPKYNANI